MKWKTWLPLFLIITLMLIFFCLRLDKYLSFESLHHHQKLLASFTQSHFYKASALFSIIYTTAVVLSIPGAVFLTLLGGFLFGIIGGTFLVVISATLGASILFFAVQSALGEALAKRASGWVKRLRAGFQENAFSYLLMLRFVPLFPFWVVNIVPAILGMKPLHFILATFIGIIPGTLVFVSVGSGLGEVLATNQSPNLGIIFELKLLLPLLALATLALLPVFFKRNKASNKNIIHYDLAVIGGGAAGLSMASGSVQLGLKVVLVEPNQMGGDCLNYGCVPSKSLLSATKAFYFSNEVNPDFSKVMAHVKQVIAHIAQKDSVKRFSALGVKVIQESGHFIGRNQFQVKKKIIQAKHFVIATGSLPAIVPIPGLEKVAYLTNETIFDLEELPSHLIVIGGGPIGCELAQAFAMLGAKVTILEASSILPKDDDDCVAIIRKQLLSMGVDIIENAKILKIEGDKTLIKVHLDNKKTISGRQLLMATGRRANVQGLELEKAGVDYDFKGIKTNARLQTTNKKIYAIGDVVGPYQFTHMASYQAGIALKNIVFKLPAKVNYQAVPWVTYTEPELAHVGMMAKDALNNPKLKITEFPFEEVDRAQTDGKILGKIKVITNQKGLILGVSIVGAQAGELILPWVMAIRERKSLRAFTDCIAPYPTLSEISKLVASEYYKPMLFSSKVRWLVSWLNKLG